MATRGASPTREDGRHWLPSQGVDPAPLAELNSECLGLLAMRASEAESPRAAAVAGSPARAMGRAAGPRRAAPVGGAVQPVRRRLRLCTTLAGAALLRSARRQPTAVTPAYFEPAAARSITRRMLVYGWHLARSRPRAACLVFGATISAVESLAACSLAALEAAAERNAETLASALGESTRILARVAGDGVSRRRRQTA